jgi:hypothetical protein
MGSLAFWGGVAGAAQGAQSAIQEKVAERKSEWDEARERRILELKDEMAKEHEASQQKHEVNITGMQVTGRAENTATETEAAAARQTSEQDYKRKEGETERDWKARQNQLDREAAEKRAGIAASAKKGGAGSKRFTPKVVQDTRTGANNIPETFDKVVIVDQNSGRTFEQKGERYIPQGMSEGEIRRAPRAAIADLVKHPEDIDVFLHDYKYLPIEVFGQLTNQGQDMDTGEPAAPAGWEDQPAVEEPQSAAP